MFKNPCLDPFFSTHLNPLFYEAWKQYWDFIFAAEIPEGQREELEKTELNLLRFGFRNLFKPFFLNRLEPIDGRVTLLSKVYADGLGDYFALLKSARVLKEAFPNIDVHLLYSHQVPLPSVALEEYQLTPGQMHPCLVTNEKEQASFEKSLIENRSLQGDLALVHIALAFNTFDVTGLAEKSFYFAETGNFQGIANYLQRNWYSMGLQPFEEGIFLSGELPPKEKGSAAAVYLCYITKTPQQQLVFIYLASLLQKNDPRDIEIVLPQIPNLDQWHFNDLWLFQMGISQVVAGTRILVDTGHPSDKRVVLNQRLPIPKPEFQKIMASCEELTGCTGDNSLSECLIAGKIPFYEQRKHKAGTIQSLVHMASYLNLRAIYDYLKAMDSFAEQPTEILAEQLFECLQRPQFKKQWKELREFVKRYYCFEDSFISHLNRHLTFLAHPERKKQEEELILGFYQGKLTPEQVCRQFV